MSGDGQHDPAGLIGCLAMVLSALLVLLVGVLAVRAATGR